MTLDGEREARPQSQGLGHDVTGAESTNQPDHARDVGGIVTPSEKTTRREFEIGPGTV